MATASKSYAIWDAGSQAGLDGKSIGENHAMSMRIVQA